MELITKFSNQLSTHTKKTHCILCISTEQKRTSLGHHLQHHQKFEVLGINLTRQRKDLYRENLRKTLKMA